MRVPAPVTVRVLSKVWWLPSPEARTSVAAPISRSAAPNGFVPLWTPTVVPALAATELPATRLVASVRTRVPVPFMAKLRATPPSSTAPICARASGLKTALAFRVVPVKVVGMPPVMVSSASPEKVRAPQLTSVAVDWLRVEVALTVTSVSVMSRATAETGPGMRASTPASSRASARMAKSSMKPWALFSPESPTAPMKKSTSPGLTVPKFESELARSPSRYNWADQSEPSLS